MGHYYVAKQRSCDLLIEMIQQLLSIFFLFKIDSCMRRNNRQVIPAFVGMTDKKPVIPDGAPAEFRNLSMQPFVF
jgi:hypothetical protein